MATPRSSSRRSITSRSSSRCVAVLSFQALTSRVADLVFLLARRPTSARARPSSASLPARRSPKAGRLIRRISPSVACTSSPSLPPRFASLPLLLFTPFPPFASSRLCMSLFSTIPPRCTREKGNSHEENARSGPLQVAFSSRGTVTRLACVLLSLPRSSRARPLHLKANVTSSEKGDLCGPTKASLLLLLLLPSLKSRSFLELGRLGAVDGDCELCTKRLKPGERRRSEEEARSGPLYQAAGRRNRADPAKAHLPRSSVHSKGPARTSRCDSAAA